MQVLRRFALAMSCVCLCSMSSPLAKAAGELRVATFRCDVTPPLGQPMFACDALRIVEQPLLAKGVIIEADGQRYVLCAVDWCELCNGSHDVWRRMIATAARTEPARVAVQCTHAHAAPLVDIDAQKLLAEYGAQRCHLDRRVLDEIERRVAAAVAESLARLEPFNRIGTGQAKVDRVASSRRPVNSSGAISVRYSTCEDAATRALPEGMIDPYLKTITLARDDKPIVRLHYYATHPQAAYGNGRASSEVCGIAREALEEQEHVFQVYFTGCGGNITLGKYNDGAPGREKELADRLLAGMEAAVKATKLAPAGDVRWRTFSLMLPRRTDPGFAMSDCIARIKDPKTSPVDKLYQAAVRMAFLQRSGQPIELSSLQMGDVHIVHLPGEPFVCFQLAAQQLQPTGFVAVAGYGDCAPGYICHKDAFREGGYEPTDSSVKPESEILLKEAISGLLGDPCGGIRSPSQHRE
jgi:hypothetical protein